MPYSRDFTGMQSRRIYANLNGQKNGVVNLLRASLITRASRDMCVTCNRYLFAIVVFIILIFCQPLCVNIRTFNS